MHEGQATLILTDITGREIKRKTIAAKQGDWVSDTRGRKAGVYMYKIAQDGQQLITGRIAVVK